MIYAGVEELKERARREGLGQGRSEGRATMVCRLARLKFGAETAERLAGLLEEVSDPEQIARIGDRIIECETGEELLARAGGLTQARRLRSLTSPRSTHLPAPSP